MLHNAYDDGMSSSREQMTQTPLQTLTPFPAVPGNSAPYCADGVCVLPTAQDPATENSTDETDDTVAGPRRRGTATNE